jgi:hypothetical protein
MTRVLKILTVAAALVALCGVILSAAYTQTVEEEVTRLRRESRSDIVYLRTRVRELESMLTAELAGRLEPPDLPVDGVPEDTDPEEVTTDEESAEENDTSDTRPEENTDGETQEGEDENKDVNGTAVFMVFDSNGTLHYDAHVVNGQVVDANGNPIEGCTVDANGNAVDAYMNVIDPDTGAVM